MGLFFKDKPKSDKPTNKVVKSTSASLIPVDTAHMSMPELTSVNEYVEHLQKVMQSHNQSGIDYMEFVGAVKTLDGQPISEEQKYVITYPTYNASGMTTNKLITSAKFYIGVVEREKIDFDNEMTQTREVLIAGKEATATKLSKEIEMLTKQIQEKSAEVQKLNEEVANTKYSLDTKEAAFNNAFNTQISVINDHITKFEKYLPYVKSTSK